MRVQMVAIVALALAGGAAQARVRPIETITYTTGPCFGFCPAYTVQVSSNGHGVFTGNSHTAVRGARAFRVSPAQFAAFRSALTPVRPNGAVAIDAGTPACGPAATDQITVKVQWSGGDRRSSALTYYYGCGMDQRATLRAALNEAPKTLPIAAFIGKR